MARSSSVTKKGFAMMCPNCHAEWSARYIRSVDGQDVAECEKCKYSTWRKDFVVREGPDGTMSVWLEEVYEML